MLWLGLNGIYPAGRYTPRFRSTCKKRSPRLQIARYCAEVAAIGFGIYGQM